MKRLFIPLLIVSSLSGAVTGCTSWPREYKGVTLDEVERRSKNAQSDILRRPVSYSLMPDACSQAYEAHVRGTVSTQGKVTEVWENCLEKLKKMEEKGQAQQARREMERRREDERNRRSRQQERKENGPRFLRLYNVAQYDGENKANKVLEKYGGKYRINPHIQLSSCRGGICKADLPEVPQGMTGSGKSLDIIVKGIHAEPGRSLSEFELVGFETYGHGTRQSAAAVFTRRTD